MLEEVKDYLRIDGTDEDSFIMSLISAAKQYIKGGTGCIVDENNDLHKLAVNLLATHWYENREAVGKTDALAFSLQSIFMQMTYGSDSI